MIIFVVLCKLEYNFIAQFKVEGIKFSPSIFSQGLCVECETKEQEALARGMVSGWNAAVDMFVAAYQRTNAA